MTENIEEQFKNRLRKARDGEIEENLEEQAVALGYEVGRCHGAVGEFEEFTDIGWKDVIEWKEEIKNE